MPEPVKKAEAKPLTTLNWTPDIVASILGTLIGIQLGFMMLFIHLLVPFLPGYLFGLLIALLVAYAFNRIVFHMELEERRHFQQAFSILIPATTYFFTIAILANTVVSYAKNKAGALINKMNPAAFITGDVIKTSTGTVSLNYQTPLLWTALLALVILLPFLIHAVRMKQFRASWLLYLLIPISLCGLVLFVAMAMTGILV